MTSFAQVLGPYVVLERHLGRKALYVPGPPDRPSTLPDFVAMNPPRKYSWGYIVLDRVGKEQLRADVQAIGFIMVLFPVLVAVVLLRLWSKAN